MNVFYYQTQLCSKPNAPQNMRCSEEAGHQLGTELFKGCCPWRPFIHHQQKRDVVRNADSQNPPQRRSRGCTEVETRDGGKWREKPFACAK